MKPELIHLKEVNLEFGNEQKCTDPRDGITLFGVFKKAVSSSIGIIGTREGIMRCKKWLQSISEPVLSDNEDIARPFFPGIQAAYQLDLNLEEIPSIIVNDKEISKYLRYTDRHQRNHNLTNLYSNPLITYQNEGETPVHTWIVMIPDDIWRFGRPKSNIPKSDDNIKIKIKSKYERNDSVQLLFGNDKNADLRLAYKFEPNFHNQLKAKLLKERIIIQIIKESTIAYEELFSDELKIQRERIFDSAKAWNISNTLCYKLGGLPWKLGEIRKGVCYIGLVYKKTNENLNSKYACCAAQMFLDSGDGMVFKGNIGKWYNPVTNEYHISKGAAKNLLNKALNAFLSVNNGYPKQIFIHAKTYFNDEEWSGFSEAVKGLSEVVGVRIRDENIFKLYRNESYPIPRGSTLKIDEKNAYLWTKGYIPRIQTVMGLETPNPLKIEIIRGEENIIQVCKDVLALSKLNYNACIFSDGTPVTLRFADVIGSILTAAPLDDIGVLPFRHYI